MMLSLYRVATALGGPLVRLYLARRMARGKEDRQRFAERLGVTGLPRPEAPVVWLHGASVGECLSALPLIAAIRERHPALAVLVTSGTVTSARLMAERLPPGAFHQYVPVDRTTYVRRFLDHWRPGCAIWLESEFWPNMILETSARGVPMVLVNGRVSDRSLEAWRKRRRMIRRLLAGFTLCLGQTEEDTRRLVELGASRTACHGNIKFAAPPLPADPGMLAELSTCIGDRPRWLAASTHAGEEILVAGIHRALARERPGLLTMIVPRHPDRGAEIAAELAAAGFKVARRAAGEPLVAETEIYIADTLGELGLFYRVAGIAFIGRSLVPMGGQNPLEPARLGCAVAFGPHTFNFTDMTGRMEERGAATRVADDEALAALVGCWLDQPEARAEAAAAARAFADAEAGVLDAVMAELAPFLGALEGRRP